MRLLSTTGEPRLKTFINEETRPPYAILSHCWMEDSEDEVVFSDLANLEEARTKLGWQKLDYARRQAAKDNYEWVWADTVCIDKSSSAELSEAINSMFKWYQKSAVCYAYLADMPDPGHDGSPQNDEEAQTRDSELKIAHQGDEPALSLGPVLDLRFCWNIWFTRGWTLQEMLAPTSVRFYSDGWTFLGTRWELRDLVTRCTRVQAEYLENPGFWLEASVARRMSWAASRLTTRVEDRAYSLLGIFGVNMPIIYGEGEKAFLRLQQEIIRTDPDQSMLAWTSNTVKDWSSTGVHHGVLADSPDRFLGCADIVPLQRSQYKHCEVTNTGIRLRLPLRIIGDREDRVVVMLQCRDTSKPRAAVLCCFYIEQRTGDEFIVGDPDLWSAEAELALMEVGTEWWIPQQWSPENITLLFNRPKYHSDPPVLKLDGYSTTLIVRSGTTQPARYQGICRAEPSEYWDETDHSFDVPSPRYPTISGRSLLRKSQIFEALLTFEGHNGEKRNLCVFLFHFFGWYRFELQFVQNNMPDWQQGGTRSRAISSATDKRSVEYLIKSNIATAACVLANGNTLEARMWIECVLDQNLVILSVVEETTAQTGVEQEGIKQKDLPDDCRTINGIEPSSEDVEEVMKEAYVCRGRALRTLKEHRDVWRCSRALHMAPICSDKALKPAVVSFHDRTLKDVYACKFCCDAPDA